jgi:hypothetical protein
MKQLLEMCMLYVQQLQIIHEKLLDKCLAIIVNRKNVSLLHDNARPHTEKKFSDLVGLFHLIHYTPPNLL